MNLTLRDNEHCLLFVISLLLTQFAFSQTSYEWQKKPNVAQYKGADWNNLLFKKSNINLEQAFEIADTNENVNYFFFMKSSMFLEGKSGPKGFTEKGLFKKGDAVFFSGKPWLSSAPMADSYVKIPKPDSYNPKIEKTKDGATLLKYAPIKFARGTTKIIDGTESVIIKLAQYLKKNKNLSLKIVGHTDNIGSKKQNLILSQQRADHIKELLIKKGIKSNRIKAIGMGSSQPLYKNSSESNRQKNRRVEFIIPPPT